LLWPRSELHLDRVLFTGKDFVLLGPGATHRRRLAERKRKATALRDVASMIRSFGYAAAMRVPNPGAVSGHDGLLLHFSEGTCKPRAMRLSLLGILQ
jgi:hypothetical protein